VAQDGGRTYKIDIATGNGSSSDSSVGLLGEVMVVERPDLTTRTPTDSTGRGVKILVSDVYQLGSQGWKKTESITTQVVAGRLSWRQINNYQDLKNAP
jgi:type IV pilus assembly protein PilY1